MDFSLSAYEWQAIRLSFVVAANAVAMGLPLAILVSLADRKSVV